MRGALDDLVDEVLELRAGLGGAPSPASHRGPAEVQDEASRDTKVTEALQVVAGIVNPSSVSGSAAEDPVWDADATDTTDAANAANAAPVSASVATSAPEKKAGLDVRRQSHGSGGEGDDDRLGLRE